MRCTTTTTDPAQTEDLGRRLGGACRGGEVLCLYGELGSGKTTLVRGLAVGLGVTAESVSSPTFTLMQSYEGRRLLHHFDFYRLSSPEEILGIGCEEFLSGSDGVAVVEWADRFGTFRPEARLDVELIHEGPDRRRLVMTATDPHHRLLLEAVFSGRGTE